MIQSRLDRGMRRVFRHIGDGNLPSALRASIYLLAATRRRLRLERRVWDAPNWVSGRRPVVRDDPARPFLPAGDLPVAFRGREALPDIVADDGDGRVYFG